MSSRREVVKVLEELAFAAELLDDRRARSFGAASWAVRQASGDLAEMLASGELAELRGVGKATIEIVAAALAGERPALVDELVGQIPAGLFEVRRVRGLGPKKVKALWRELAITSLGELEYACRENRLVELAGFGAKTQTKVAAAIADIRATAGMLRRDQAAAVLAAVVDRLIAHPGVSRVDVAGDYRRGLELVRALVVVASGDDVGAAVRAVEVGDVVVVVADGDDYGVAMSAATGPDEHFAALVERAGARGSTLTAEGLRHDGERLVCANEDDLYAALDLHLVAPERRGVELCSWQRHQPRPRLVTRTDLVGALHNHTVASDGSDTLAAMVAAAEARDLTYLGISDHSQTASYARGLEPERLKAQIAEIAGFAAAKGGCAVLSGVESDILADGALDYPAELLAELDFVIASVHNRHGQSGEQMTARMVAAARNPWTDVIGHPTGRLLLGRPPTDVDIEVLLDACAASGCAIELNADPQRLDLRVRHLAMARARGVLVSIAADAHSAGALDNLVHGIAIARRAGLQAGDVLNTRPLAELRKWLAARKQRAAELME